MSQADVVATGTEPVDERIGGLPARRITLVSGVPGAGRTCFALAFLVAALRRGEAACLVTTDAPEAVLEFCRNFLRVDLAPHLRSRRLTILTYGPGFDAKIRALGHVEKPVAELSRLVAERGWKHLVVDTVDPILVAAEPSRLKHFITAVVRSIGRLGITCLCTATDSSALKLATDELASHVSCSLALHLEGKQRFLRFPETARSSGGRSWTMSQSTPMALPTWPIAFHFVPGVGIVSSARLNESTMPEVLAVKKAQPASAVPVASAPASSPAPAGVPTVALSALSDDEKTPVQSTLHLSSTLMLTAEDLRSTQKVSMEFIHSIERELAGEATGETEMPEREPGKP